VTKKHKLKPFTFDYWGFFKAAVNDLKIPPSEAWGMTYPELFILLEIETNTVDNDISMMINAERKMGGAKDKRFLL
jgi:hypothetical protein